MSKPVKDKDLLKSLDCSVRVVDLPQNYEPSEIIDNLKKAGNIQQVKLGEREMVITFTNKQEKELSRMYNGCPIGTKYSIKLAEPVNLDVFHYKGEIYPALEGIKLSNSTILTTEDTERSLNDSNLQDSRITNYSSSRHLLERTMIESQDINYWKQKCDSLEEDLVSWRIKYHDVVYQYEELNKKYQDLKKITSTSQDLSFTLTNLPKDSTSIFHSIAVSLETHFYKVCRTDQDRNKIASLVRRSVIDTATKWKIPKELNQYLATTEKMKDYIMYISNEQNPGGQMELSILADCYGVQFCVFNITDEYVRPSLVPPESTRNRIYLLGDMRGKMVVYDTIFAYKMKDGLKNEEMFMFSQSDKFAYFEALKVAETQRQGEKK